VRGKRKSPARVRVDLLRSPALSNMRLHLLLLACAAPLAGAQVQFTDVTQAAGLDLLQNQLGGVLSSEAAFMTGGAAAGDLDGDGWVDLVVTRFDGDALLFLNLGVDASGAHQGFVDIAPTAFASAPPGPRSNGVALGDVDGDGDLDLYVTSLFTTRYQLWINDGAGHFTEEALARGAAIESSRTHLGFSASFGDFDRDGYLDLYVTEWGHISGMGGGSRSHARLLRNRGAAAPGTFVDVTGTAGVSVEGSPGYGPSGALSGVFAFTPRFADFDDDGWPDLAIAGDFHTSRLFWNQGDGTFLDGTTSAGVGTDENGMGATVGDFDGDGRLDWFIASIYDPTNPCGPLSCNWDGSGNRLYLGQSGRRFVDRTNSGVRDGGWGWGATALDFDNDGRLDLAQANGMVFTSTTMEDSFNTDLLRLWRNTGSRFQEASAATGLVDTRSGKGLCCLDYDRDGDLDLFVVNNSDAAALYRNDGGNAQNWLQLTLHCQGANKLGIGARVRVWPSSSAPPMVHEVSASSGYLSQDECLAHFGLGGHATAARVEVRWPSGLVSEWLDVPANQRLQLVEP
jgi:hypothetical protein